MRWLFPIVALSVALGACGSSSSSGHGGRPPPGAPHVVGVSQSDHAYCQQMQHAKGACRAQPYPTSSELVAEELQRCVKSACVDRQYFGAQVSDVERTCNLRQPCSSKDPCRVLSVGAQASTPRATAAFQRCSAYHARCGDLQSGHGKTLGCDVFAVFGGEFQEALERCFQQPCELSAMCTQQVFTSAWYQCGA